MSEQWIKPNKLGIFDIDKATLKMLGDSMLLDAENSDARVVVLNDKDLYKFGVPKDLTPQITEANVGDVFIKYNKNGDIIEAGEGYLLNLTKRAAVYILRCKGLAIIIRKKDEKLMGIVETPYELELEKYTNAVDYFNRITKTFSEKYLFILYTNGAFLINNKTGELEENYVNGERIWVDNNDKRIANAVINSLSDNIKILSRKLGVITLDEYLSIFHTKIADEQYNGLYSSIAYKDTVACKWRMPSGKLEDCILNTKTLNITSSIGTLTKQHADIDIMTKLKNRR